MLPPRNVARPLRNEKFDDMFTMNEFSDITNGFQKKIRDPEVREKFK